MNCIDQQHKNNQKIAVLFVCFAIFYFEYLYFNHHYSGIWPSIIQKKLELKLISIRHIFLFLPLYIIVLMIFKYKARFFSLIPNVQFSYEIILSFILSHILFLYLLDWLFRHDQINFMNVWVFIGCCFFLLVSIASSLIFAFYDKVLSAFIRLLLENKILIVYCFALILLTLIIDLSYASVIESSYIESSWIHLPKLITFELIHFLLQMFSSNVFMNSDTLTIGTNNFWVYIGPPCSGSVGVNLFLLFAGIIYFSEKTRFSSNLFGFSILIIFGLLFSFIGNAIRIFLLISIGDQGYGDIASQGFHSSAGIFFFLILIVCFVYFYVLITTKKWPSLKFKHKQFLNDNEAYPYIFPLVVWMLLGMAARPFYYYWDWGYALRVFLFLYVIWLFKGWIKEQFNSNKYGLPIILGVSIGLIWIYFSQKIETEVKYKLFLNANPLVIGSWIYFKIIGFCLIVPVVEELFFRGFLSRVLINFDFKKIALGKFSIISFLGSSLIFAWLHQNYFLGFFAGCLFNILLIRSKSLGPVIICHIVANIVICLYVLYFNRWDFWL